MPRCHQFGKDIDARKPRVLIMILMLKQGSIITSSPMNLLCLDITTRDPSKDGKENVIVMTDAYSNFRTTEVTYNQHAKLLLKLW